MEKEASASILARRGVLSRNECNGEKTRLMKSEQAWCNATGWLIARQQCCCWLPFYFPCDRGSVIVCKNRLAIHNVSVVQVRLRRRTAAPKKSSWVDQRWHIEGSRRYEMSVSLERMRCTCCRPHDMVQGTTDNGSGPVQLQLTLL